MNLLQQIKAAIELLDDPEWVALSGMKKALAIAPEILRATCLIIEGMDPDEIDAFAPQLIETAEFLFDEYLAPIDIPGVGPVFERFLDASVRKQIAPAINAFIESR